MRAFAAQDICDGKFNWRQKIMSRVHVGGMGRGHWRGGRGPAPARPLGHSETPELYLEGGGSHGRFRAEVWAAGSSTRQVLGE